MNNIILYTSAFGIPILCTKRGEIFHLRCYFLFLNPTIMLET